MKLYLALAALCLVHSSTRQPRDCPYAQSPFDVHVCSYDGLKPQNPAFPPSDIVKTFGDREDSMEKPKDDSHLQDLHDVANTSTQPFCSNDDTHSFCSNDDANPFCSNDDTHSFSSKDDEIIDTGLSSDEEYIRKFWICVAILAILLGVVYWL